MNNILDEIKARRTANTEQSLMMLDMVAFSDTETKYSLLATAGHYLQDPAIIEKWMALIAAETDTRLKADMLYHLAAGGLQAIPDKNYFIELLTGMLQQDESRDIILPLLGRFSITDTVAREKLRTFYTQQDNADTCRQILSWLLIRVDADEADIAFYTALTDKVDEADKMVLVNRLLLQDRLTPASIEKLLQPEEPSSIKEMVLRYCVDRSLIFEAALCHLIRVDKSPLLRKWSIQLLAVHGIRERNVTDTILHALKQDPDAGVRQAARNVFQYSISLTPANIDYLCTCLLTEKDTAAAAQLLQLLAPYTERNEPLTNALLHLLEQDIPATLAVQLYDILGRQVPVRYPLFEKFITAYEKEQRDDCKAIILKSITAAVTFGDELNAFYAKALEAPSTAIKEWAIRGFLLIPLTAENTAVVAAAAPVLLHRELSQPLRLLLAKKISCIPQLPSATVQVFSRLADHETNEQIRDVCTKVQEQAITQSGGEHINWEQWLHKANVAHDFSGIFPHLWLFYNDNPQMANRILMAALDPDSSGSLYQESVSDVEILGFLAVNAGIDEQMSRYALHQLLHTNLGNESKFKQYLLVLKSNPAAAELKEGLWLLLEKRSRYIPLIQLDELMRMVWGTGLEAEFRRRLLQQTTIAGVLPYMQYLAANSTWEPAPDFLKAALQIPGMTEEADFKEVLRTACRNGGWDMEELLRTAAPVATRQTDDGPGFAD
jgi:hypothetical protein